MPEIDPLRIDLPAELHGPRVTLRPYREEDAGTLWEAIDGSRASIGAWMPWVESFHRPEDAAATVRRLGGQWLMREQLVVGIFDRTGGQLLGGSGLNNINWQIRRFAVGYWLRESAVGHGYASETVQVLTRFAFDQLQANRVEIRMDTDNLRSRAVPERLGFVYEGCLRQDLPDVHGLPRDSDVFALIPDEFKRLDWARLS